MDPEIFPMNNCKWVGREVPCDAAAKGVVLLMPSVSSGTHFANPPGNPVNGSVQLLVIAAGKVMNTNTLPSMAGLHTFLAKPPNTCFPKVMAKAMPTAAIQYGTVTGRIKVKRKHDTNTDSVGLPFLDFSKKYSVTTPTTVTTAKTEITLHGLFSQKCF